jgi:hypothetical protein
MNQIDKIRDQLLSITKKYGDQIDLEHLLDFSDITDNFEELSKAIAKQPAIYAYLANLLRISESNLGKLESQLDEWKISKIGTITELLKTDGVSHPTAKMIESKLNRYYSGNEFYTTIMPKIQLWRSRKETLSIAVKAIEMRENSFKSISYLMSSMSKSGTMYPRVSNRKQVEV